MSVYIQHTSISKMRKLPIWVAYLAALLSPLLAGYQLLQALLESGIPYLLSVFFVALSLRIVCSFIPQVGCPNFFLRPLPPNRAIGTRGAIGALIAFGAGDQHMQYNYVRFPHSFFNIKRKITLKSSKRCFASLIDKKTWDLNGAGYNSPNTNGVINEQILSIINGYQITFYTLESTRRNAIRKHQMRSLPRLYLSFSTFISKN